MEMINMIFAALGGTGAGLVIAGFLGKKLISHELEKSRLLYEKELAAKAQVLKNDLSIFAHEQMVGISRIDAQRADAIKSVYSVIAKWAYAISEINYPKQTDFSLREITEAYFTESLAKVDCANEMAFEVLIENGIYFSSSTYNQITDVLKLALIYSIEVKKIFARSIHAEGEIIWDRVNEELQKEKVKFEAAYDPIRGSLVEEFRRIIRAQ